LAWPLLTWAAARPQKLSKKEEEYMRIAEKGDVDALLKLYPEAATPKTPGTLTSLSQKKGGSVLDVLFNRGFSLDCQNESGTTALHVAALHGHKAFVDKLLDQLFNINLKDDSGNSALHLAAWNAHIDIMRMLIRAGANVNEQNAEGNTPLHFVAQFGKDKMPAVLLLESKANPVLRNGAKETPLDTAARYGRTDVVSVLATTAVLSQIYQKGARPVASPLHLAARNGHTDAIRILLQAGVAVNGINLVRGPRTRTWTGGVHTLTSPPATPTPHLSGTPPTHTGGQHGAARGDAVWQACGGAAAAPVQRVGQGPQRYWPDAPPAVQRV
jgi:hypothetical protein